MKSNKQQNSDKYEFMREKAEEKNDESDANSCVKTATILINDLEIPS